MGKAFRGNGVKNEPPFLPVNFFIRNFSPAQKGVFAIALVILGLLGIYTLWASVFPLAWTPTFQTLAEAYKSSVEVSRLNTPYLSFPLTFPVYQSWVSFYAGPMLPQEVLILTFTVLQTLAWSLWVTAATYIRSRWAYGIYFLFMFYLFLSNVSQYIFPGLSFPLIEAGLSIPLLILVYLFHSQRLRVGFLGRYLTFFILQALLFGYLFYLGNWQAWYFTFINQFYYLFFLTFLFFLFISKELLNLFILWGNNRSNPRKIWSLSVYRFLWLPLLAALFFLAIGFETLGTASTTLTSLAYLLIGVFAILTPFTSQNLFRALQHIFSAHSIWAFLLVSWSIIVMSFCALQLSMGDIFLSQTLAKVFAQLLFVGTLCYVMYLESNFFQFLGRRMRIFFLLAKGPAFPFGVMYLPAILLFVFFQGQEDWKLLRTLPHSQLLLEGDAQVLARQSDAAINYYTEAANFIPFSPKAQYNQGALLMLNPQRTGLAIEAFKKSLRLCDIPQARLNSNQLLEDLLLRGSSQSILKEGLSHKSAFAGRLAHNLALSFLKEGVRDSALYFFQKAQEWNPELYISQIHLAKIYFDMGKDSLGRAFWKAGVRGANKDEQVALNALYFDISDSLLSTTMDQLPAELFSKALVQNVLLAEFAQGDLEKAREKSQLIEQHYDEAEIELLYGYLEMERDSLEIGKSKLEYLSQRFPELRGLGNYLLGVSYVEKGLWGMARKYFQRSAEAGMESNYYNAYVLDALRGIEGRSIPDSVKNDSLVQLIAKENKLIQWVDKDTLNFDLDRLTPQEKQRMAVYAFLQNHCYLPFRLLFPLGDNAIVEEEYISHLENECSSEGFSRFLSEEIEANLSTAVVEKVTRSIGNQMPKLDPVVDTTALRKNWETKPWDEKAGEKWVAYLLEEDQLEEAHSILSQILSINDQNPTFWQQYGRIMEAWGMQEEKDFALEQMETLLP